MNKLKTIPFCDLALRIGRSTQVFALIDLRHAQDLWEQIRLTSDYTTRNEPRVRVINPNSGKVVAEVSYNGRLWRPGCVGQKDKEIVVGNYKSAAQQEKELCAS